MARINLGIVVLLLCAAMSLVQVIGNTCPKESDTTVAKLCRGLTGWAGCILCLASCAVLIIGPFRSSVSI